MENVSKIRESGLCISCEACHAICPVDAIEMLLEDGQFVPSVDEETCIDCGKCLNVCYGDHLKTEKIDAGDHIEVYDAYVPEEDIRKNSTSGGVISRLLYALLEEEQIDGAFVLDFDNFNGEPARLRLVEDPEDVYEAAGSKYIPASVFNILKRIEDEKSYAVVSTPCQFYAVKEYLKDKNIQADILYLGIFCDRTMNLNFLKYMEDNFGKKGEKITKIDYRNKEKRGWPGDVKLWFDSSREVIVDRKRRTEVKDFFMLERCLYCPDKLNRKADISFGDCYIHGKTDPERTSVIVRTEKGKKIFEKYSNLFELNESSMEGVKLAQVFENQKENLKRARLLESGKTSKDLKIRKKKVKAGRDYSKTGFKFAQMSSNFRELTDLIQKSSKVGVKLLLGPKKTERTGQNKVVITGGGLTNKGAQSMTFTVVSNISQALPSHDIYLFNTEDHKRDKVEKEKYPFEILPWDKKTRLGILEDEDHPFREIFENADLMLDVSGYRLSSQLGPPYYAAYSYLLDICIAKKFSLPIYMLPQSIGPFDYKSPSLPILWILQKKYLPYPERIYPREEAGLQAVKKFTKYNVDRRHDIVLTDGYQVSDVYDGDIKNIEVENPSVGVVPNQQISERIDYGEMIDLYGKVVEKLRKEDLHVYLIPHSNEDTPIVRDIKDHFSEDARVIPITEELYSFELENLISKLKFMVASRYHSIIHAYKNAIPCVVLGWAVKYRELLRDFCQLEYIFDVRKGVDTEKLLNGVGKMLERFDEERETIESELEEIRRKEGKVFDKIMKDME